MNPSEQEMPDRVFVVRDGLGQGSVHDNMTAALKRALVPHGDADSVVQEYICGEVHEKALAEARGERDNLQKQATYWQGETEHARARIDRLVAAGDGLSECLPGHSNDHEHYDAYPGDSCSGCDSYEKSGPAIAAWSAAKKGE